MTSFVTIYPSDLEYAVNQGTITEKQSKLLWPEFTSRSEKRFTTTLETLGYTAGALLIIGSLTWFTSLAYNDPHSLALFWLSTFYVAAFGSTGAYFWTQTPTDYSKILGGIFITIATSVSPVATFALDRYYGWEPTYMYRGSLESATLAGVSLIALSVVQFSPILIPLNFGLFGFVFSTIAPAIFGPNPSRDGPSDLSMIIGVVNLAIGYFASRSFKSSNYSFWMYLFGLIELCGGLNAQFFDGETTTEGYKIAYFIINIAIFAAALPLNQAIFLLFGGYGICNFIYDQLYIYGNQTIDCSVTAAFGAIICISAYVVDIRNQNSNYPWWAYLFGVGTVETATTWLFLVTYHNNAYVGIGYFLFNVFLTLLYIPTKRWQFVLGGTNGVLFYINWLMQKYASSYELPLMITLVGLVLIGFSVWISRSKITASARRVLRRGQPTPSSSDEQNLL